MRIGATTIVTATIVLAAASCSTPLQTTAPVPATVTVTATCTTTGHPSKLVAGQATGTNTITPLPYDARTGQLTFDIGDLTLGYVIKYSGCGSKDPNPSLARGQSFIYKHLVLTCSPEACTIGSTSS